MPGEAETPSIDQASADDALADVPVTDPAAVPPDQGDSGQSEVDTEILGLPRALTPMQRRQARRIVAKGCRLMLAHIGAVHYTQDRRRWNGINNDRRIGRNEYPGYSDCSSSATWLLWNALRVHLGMGDVVNGTGWRSGYTGTMLSHGSRVAEANVQVGDCAFYGPPGSTGSHVVMCLGGGMVFSHGSEEGPFKLPLRYRGDLMEIRRYF